MKTILLLGLLPVYPLLLAAQTSNPTDGAPSSVPPATPYTVVSRGPNSAVWERTSYQRSPDGQIVSHRDRYVQLATGLNHLVNGRYVPSSDQIVLSPDGTSASATNGQAQAFFPADIDNGVIKLITPDGKTLESQPIGLGFSDGSNTVLLATLTNSVGQILPGGNEVLYTNAFAGLHADLLYKYTLAGLEQDVVLRQQLPDPKALGLRARSTTLDMMTEFFNAPPPQIRARSITTVAGNLEDDSLTFGAMWMGPGKAFLLGTNSPPVRVEKQWYAFSNHQFLVEKIPYLSVTNELSQLPQAAFVKPPSSLQVASSFSSRSRGNEAHVNSELERASLRRLLLWETRSRHLAVARKKNHMQFAQNRPPNRGLVLDYQILNPSQNNYTFKGDTTYYITNGVWLYGTTTIEGGAVIKASGYNMTIDPNGTIVCKTSPYRPGVFTSVNDNSVGESIGTNSPQPYDVRQFLEIYSTNISLHDLRFNYAGLAMEQPYDGSWINLTNCQFYDTDVAVSGYNVGLYNVLISRTWPGAHTGTDEAIQLSGPDLIGENVTADGGSAFTSEGTIALTNCIITGQSLVSPYGPPPTLLTNDTAWLPSPTVPIYQTAAGGNYYLTNNSPYRDVGTTNTDPALLDELRTTTTEPPDTNFIGQTISTNATLYPLGLADTNTPDLGYHYPILDYVFSKSQFSGSLTIEPGTAVGWYGQGLTFSASSGFAGLNFDGLLTSPCYFVRCNTVQENDQTGDTSAIGISFSTGGASYDAKATFTRFSAVGDLAAFCDANDLYMNAYNCEFWDGQLGGYIANQQYGLHLSLVNSLLDRSALALDATNVTGRGSLVYGCSFSLQNCTLHGGSLAVSQTNSDVLVHAYDSAFDGTNIALTSGITVQTSQNAYLTNAPTLPNDTNGPPPLTNFDWQVGPLGDFYLPPDSPLINAGDKAATTIPDYTATVAGQEYALNLFTTQTNQTPDAGLVDIGYHYAAPLQAVSTNNFQNPLCPDDNQTFDLASDNYNNPDAWGLPVTFSITRQPQHGSLTNLGDGSYRYTPHPCYVGPDSFMYQMGDSFFPATTGTVYVMVADNLFKDTYYTPSPVVVPMNGQTNITIYASSYNCAGDSTIATNVTIIQEPAHGTLTQLSGNHPQTTYTPSNNYAGPDSFTFQVGDPCGDAARFIVPITVGTSTAGLFTVVTNVNTPNGIDYSPSENALIVSSGGGDPEFQYDDFVQLGTNTSGALTVTNFSGVQGRPDEVKLAIVKQNGNGFTNGSVYFGSYTNVGWLSADGTQSNLTWCALTNSTLTNTMHLRGGVYLDQTGVFGNDLIALASDGTGPSPSVWLVNSSGNPALLAQVDLGMVAAPDDGLEGVISLPDNTNQWGPWAGKILTGDEASGILYTIDTNGVVTPYDLGIAPDDFVFIPTDQEDLYLLDYANNRVLESSRTLLNNYAGGLLITQEEGPPALFIVKWSGTNFVSREIYLSGYTSQIEDAAFAPLHLPSQPLQ